MAYHEDGHRGLLAERLQERGHVHLVAYVEVGGGLVQDQYPGLLDQPSS